MSAEREAVGGGGGGGEKRERGEKEVSQPLLPEVILVFIALCD